MTLNIQLLTMMTMIIGGIYLGLAQETYYRITSRLRKNVFFTYFFDPIFWVVQTVILFYLLFRVNNGEIRFYIILACFLGFSMYVVLFQTTYRTILEGCIKLLTWIIKTIITLINMIIIAPLCILFRIICKALLFTLRILGNIGNFILHILHKLAKTWLPEKIYKNIFKRVTFCSTMIVKTTYWFQTVVFRKRR